MTTNPTSGVNPDAWIKVLDSAVSSRIRDAKGKEGSHKYIVLTGSQQYDVKEKSEIIKDKSFKLPLNRIVDISKAQAQELDKQFKNGGISPTEYKQKMDRIVYFTNDLIQGRVDKRYSFLRLLAYVTSAAASVFLVGIPFFVSLLRGDKKFQDDIASLKREVNTIKPLMTTGVSVSPQTGAKSSEDIKSILQEVIPEIIKPEILTDDYLMNTILQPSVDKDIEEYKSRGRVTSFEMDAKRPLSFIRNDSELNVKDESPQPPPLDLTGTDGDSYKEEAKKTERFINAALLIDALVKNETEEDQKTWNGALQSVVNQTVLNSLFFEVKALYNPTAEKYGIMEWHDVEGKNHKVLPKFPGDLPPVNLEIIRDPDTKKIKEVQITVNGFLDMVEEIREENKKIGEEVIVPKAIEGKLKFTIALDNGKAVVRDVHSSLTTSLKPSSLPPEFEVV